MLNNRLNETKIGNAEVIVDILPKGKCIPNTKINPTSITIHNTGNIGAPAKNNHNYMKNINKSGERIASWHFTVDDKYIYQAQSTNYKCYHAGCSKGNNTSIGIEICMFNDKERQRKCYENAIALVKILLNYHKFTLDDVVKHYDWTKKDCPTWLRSGKFGFTWNWFINQLKTPTQLKESVTTGLPYVVVVTYGGAEGLNIRTEPSTKGKIVGQIYKGQAFTIIEEKNGWGKLKSGKGWISLNKKYIQKK